MNQLKVGDTVKCRDKEDMLDTMYDLADAGVETDFLYEKNGQEGLWLVVTKVER